LGRFNNLNNAQPIVAIGQRPFILTNALSKMQTLYS
jgi:hypothetical protein